MINAKYLVMIVIFSMNDNLKNIFVCLADISKYNRDEKSG
jgi:hypothetical protein